ncbi:hypothetical protein BB561_002626 [Smittium simulii]|uniref:Uncharacterized protein n=1 Tax=Smittium simulii TaxID=133385 RepID=A0A2T9YPN3_9FUNG|nr:hypothetical protein BB561_002626 [Smittium simulii]
MNRSKKHKEGSLTKSLEVSQNYLCPNSNRGRTPIYRYQWISAPGMELETAKFMIVIHVARVLIVDNIKCSPTSLNQ